MSEELKPCPFCGDPMKRGVMKAVASMGPNVRGVHIQSVVCWEHEGGHGYCQIENHKFADNEEEVSRWNSRHERTCHWVYFDDSVSTPDFHEDDWHLECSECGFDPESIMGPNVDDPECLSCFVHCPSCGAEVVS